MRPVAVVTGAAGGIGGAVARRLAADGYDLVLADPSPRLAEAALTVERAGAAVRPAQVDLRDPEGRTAVRDAAASLPGPLTALVNNAGITRDARLVNMTERDFTDVVEVNLGVPLLLVRALQDRFAAGGAIVNVSSRAYLGNFGQFNYAMSKGGLVGLTRALALELAPDVRVNAIAPGLTATDMITTIPEEVLATMEAAIPLGRVASPEEMAAVIAFLCSRDASYVTGHVVVAGGGRSLS